MVEPMLLVGFFDGGLYRVGGGGSGRCRKRGDHERLFENNDLALFRGVFAGGPVWVCYLVAVNDTIVFLPEGDPYPGHT